MIRSRIASALCNLDAFRLFWLAAQRVVVARSLSGQRAFRVPAGAVEVGVYQAGGLNAGEIIADLSELLERLPEPSPQPPESEPELPPITSQEWLSTIAPFPGSTPYASRPAGRSRKSLVGKRTASA